MYDKIFIDDFLYSQEVTEVTTETSEETTEVASLTDASSYDVVLNDINNNLNIIIFIFLIFLIFHFKSILHNVFYNNTKEMK